MTDAEKREKVIRGLEDTIGFLTIAQLRFMVSGNGDSNTIENCIASCEYALALMKEQKPNKPHRRNGYWIEDAKTYPGAGLSNYVCSNCGEMGGTWIKHIAPDRTFPWCPFCGTKMSGKKVRYAD